MPTFESTVKREITHSKRLKTPRSRYIGRHLHAKPSRHMPSSRCPIGGRLWKTFSTEYENTSVVDRDLMSCVKPISNGVCVETRLSEVLTLAIKRRRGLC